jgi:hypothetical protein
MSKAYISTLAARTITSLNWLFSQASGKRSIIAKAALSYKPHSDARLYVKWEGTHKFVIFDIQKDTFRPEMGSFGSFDDLGENR